ncbi:MAG: protein-glutamate O-methyltransferase CheR [Phycisphaerae bacterium]|jgi:chemotaxis protein methyltransferase CheR|nr:protein-glutamate O-methyltransferase CheR [Phycisphaerae bacterium]
MQFPTLQIEQPVLTDEQFVRICRLVYEHCGINLHEGKKELVRARLAKMLRKYRFKTYDQYIDFVLDDPTQTTFYEMIDQISTNLTSFFREPKHFEYLRRQFLPALIQKKQKTGQLRIRAWSAGCSSGEEPYSIAITLLEAVPLAQSWDIRILASDISTRILRIAQEGLYEPQRVANLSAELKSRYLKPKKDKSAPLLYEVSPALRSILIFKYLNLMDPWPFRGPFDFIFCRNVMIYFDKPTQEKLVQRFHDVLDNGGLFFTGHSESLTGIRHSFRYIQPTIYRK